MDQEKKIEYLIVDTSAFIRNVQLQEIGTNIITDPSVIKEITSKRQLKRLVVLPYDLKVQEPFAEDVKIVTEFAKKTGDYISLSATDIKVMALTYHLEKEKVGTSHLKTEPKMSETIDSSTIKHDKSVENFPGFYVPQRKDRRLAQSAGRKQNKKDSGSNPGLINDEKTVQNKRFIDDADSMPELSDNEEIIQDIRVNDDADSMPELTDNEEIQDIRVNNDADSMPELTDNEEIIQERRVNDDADSKPALTLHSDEIVQDGIAGADSDFLPALSDNNEIVQDGIAIAYSECVPALSNNDEIMQDKADCSNCCNKSLKNMRSSVNGVDSMPELSDSEVDNQSDYDTALSDSDGETGDLSKKFANLKCEPTDLVVECEDNLTVDDILAPAKESINENSGDYSESDDDPEEDDDHEDDDDCEDDDDEDGWITPSNIARVKKQMNSAIFYEKAAKVACLTTDFAMQNVLMQMGLNVASLDGRVIKQMRTFILRCCACFKTTSIMTKVFCPNCGNKSLRKVSVSVDEDGNQKIHINYRKVLSAKGKKFSLPTYQGGKHASNPILFEDQPMPDQRVTKLANMKTNALDDDYIAGSSPFIMRDVKSKSAMLGIRSGLQMKHWMKKNPNECRKKRK